MPQRGRRTRRRRLYAAAIILAAGLFPSRAEAEPAKTQLWANVTLDWIKSHRFSFGAAIEPKVQVSPRTDDRWATLDVTPSAEYSKGNWFDLVGELLAARTRQTDESTSSELTPRLGFRLHILSNVKHGLLKERMPKRRLVVRSLLRLEWRTLRYSDDTPDSSSFRLRDRVEVLYPVNRRRITENGAAYLTGDAEWFWTHNDVNERYASKQRVRAGIGYRRDYSWRVETLVVWDRSRHAATDAFTTNSYAFDVHLRHVW